jgi:hypothetical protein
MARERPVNRVRAPVRADTRVTSHGDHNGRVVPRTPPLVLVLVVTCTLLAGCMFVRLHRDLARIATYGWIDF